jgi:hypothetical protein
MSDENTVSRRRALKIIGTGVGAAGAMSIYGNPVLGQHDHMNHAAKAHTAAAAAPEPRFFTPAEMAAVTAMSDLIIPTDEQSPGAKEAGVPAFIDLMVGSSSAEVRKMWRDGLAAVDAASRKASQKSFAEASKDDQVALLREMSKNEYAPKTPEEQLFSAVKAMTVDGYYTSEVGIHTDLRYKGNSYNKTFVGCTHPEHQS